MRYFRNKYLKYFIKKVHLRIIKLKCSATETTEAKTCENV